MAIKKFIRSNPHLPVKNLRLTLDYYREKLGFYDEWTFGDKDGGIRRDDLMLLFAEDDDFTGDINNSQHRLALMWFVDNIEQVLFEFKHRDIELVDDLRVHPYGLKEFAFIDVNGYFIRVAEGVEKE
jgi:glyoxalase/bleomycin resistance protein/dioxygenase superfamily protein